MATQMRTIRLSIRISHKMREQLNELSTATGKSLSFLTVEAIQSYLEIQAKVTPQQWLEP